ncbi:MAG: YqeG family HAD IIIA-type phosphatase [Clostridia bacterium]|nr:YqeG family HAD IIIA-type phosphatase [Clostridia bacterium]
MLDFFYPDFYFEKFDEVTVEFLKANNISALLLDLDNTLAPYEMSEPDEKILAYLSDLSKNGIRFAFISNNSSDKRINLFNKKIGAPAFAKAGKPFAKKTINRALSTLGVSKENAAFLGDQIFTDVCAGKFNGIRAILVPPIKDKKNLFFKFKRALEKPVLKRYFRKNKR